MQGVLPRPRLEHLRNCSWNPQAEVRGPWAGGLHGERVEEARHGSGTAPTRGPGGGVGPSDLSGAAPAMLTASRATPEPIHGRVFCKATALHSHLGLRAPFPSSTRGLALSHDPSHRRARSMPRGLPAQIRQGRNQALRPVVLHLPRAWEQVRAAWMPADFTAVVDGARRESGSGMGQRRRRGNR